ncbi:GAF domain-containing protein [Haloarcula sp. Atlit-47R]|uniref:GAF domain-containing protein n=1 Tax=Haloarcula sp. Atlit-47R TaxID=2282132 RepID=UPI000EF23BBC|nr:GAF domain-containing protein [Haloarcula sp. Atlit-47R]RLM41989.1 GAF domain-containing protein [Haloarcula sp. Atlit-47R]
MSKATTDDAGALSRTVLCVDKSDRIDAVSEAIDDEETLTAVEATSVEAATEVIAEEPVICVITAYDLVDGSGMDVINTVREHAPQVPSVLFTDLPPNEIDTASFEETIVEYLNRDLPDAHDRLGFVTNDIIEHSAQVGFLRPDDEEKRLATLSEYDIEELPIEESFERLTDLIASHFDVGVAFVGLIEEDEENFLACHGGDFDSLTREDTICTHSMLQDDVMVVENIATDSRFSKNEQLENLGIVSYAGANMTAPDGQVIGQVCAIDFEERHYDAEERAELQDFAEMAMEILDLRQSLRSARNKGAKQ